MAADAQAPDVARTSAAMIYRISRIGKFLSYLRKDFNHLRRINVEK